MTGIPGDDGPGHLHADSPRMLVFPQHGSSVLKGGIPRGNIWTASIFWSLQTHPQDPGVLSFVFYDISGSPRNAQIQGDGN